MPVFQIWQVVILSLLEVAGVNEITAKTENRGGKVETYKFKKYDLIGVTSKSVWIRHRSSLV